ncbi:biotin transporter BioY [Caenispirillum salinarum]|uniref:biotin transporter BioY n=1 Tax=Caenispirillum salinarum TaxID=859058 RepID=UPI00384DADBA
MSAASSSLPSTVARIALFAALIAALGLVPQVMLPFAGGVPITAQTLGLMLAGLILGPWRGAAAVLVFMAVVALGAPLLAGGRGGLGVFVGPTAGFLVGFPIATIVIGQVWRTLSRRMKPMVAGVLASLIGGVVVLYAFGVPGLALVTGMSLTQAAAVMVVFIPGDILKALVAAYVNREVRRATVVDA